MTLRLVGLALAALLLARPAAAFHTVFDFSIDHFEADGNMLGPYDGSPDFVDEFDAPSSVWYTAFGTSSVTGGRLHVQNPGEHYPGPDGTTLDFTEVAAQRLVGLGFGDFTATAVFDAQIPPEGHFYHFTLFTFGGGLYFNELFGVDIQTMNGVTRIEQHLVILNLNAGIYSTVQTEGRVITADDLGAQVHFRVVYDDDTGTVVSAFSLDGGVTFESPFTPAPIFTEGRTSGQFILGADPLAAPGTATTSTTTTTTSVETSTTTTTLPVLGGCERTDCLEAPVNRLRMRLQSDVKALAWGWKGAPSATLADLGDPTSPNGPRYALCLRDAAGSLILRDEIAAGGTCGGKPCWRHVDDDTLAYNDEHGGIASVRLTPAARTGSRGTVTAYGPTLFDALPPETPFTVQLEATTGACWSATFDASGVRMRGRRLIARTR